MSTILRRISRIAEHEGITITALEKQIGASKGVLSRALAKGSDIQSKWIQAIVENYHQYDVRWIVTGEGDMLPNKNMREKVKSTRPRIPLHASAGALTMAKSGVMLDQCEQLPVIENLPKYDFTIRVRGNSMVPEFHGGDEVACLFIREFSFIQWGRIHVLDTAQGIVMKMLDDAGEYFICRSANPDYKEFKIHKSEVFNIALVVGLVRTY